MDIKPLLHEEQIIKIKPEVVFIETENGTYIRNFKGNFSIQGKASYKICNWLRNKLNGTNTFKDVIEAAPTNMVDFIVKILEVLIHYQCTNMVMEREKTPISPLVNRQYSEQIAFLENHHSFPIQALTTFMNTFVFCKGNSLMLENVVISLANFGILTPKLEKIDIFCNETGIKILLEVSANNFIATITETPENLILIVETQGTHKTMPMWPNNMRSKVFPHFENLRRGCLK